MAKDTCSVVERNVPCDRPQYARSYCHMHYQRWLRTGDPLGVRPVFATARERILSHIEETAEVPPRRPELGPCWRWTSTLDKDGYGSVKVDGRSRRAHRAVYEMLVGPIPEGLTLDHLCHHPEHCPPGRSCPHRTCVNPAHLEPTSILVNTLRGGGLSGNNSRKTHCPQGHEYSPENTRVIRGRRHCVECGRTRSREFQRQKARAARAAAK